MALPPVPDEVPDKEREPDEIVEHVGPHRAQREAGGLDGPEPADRTDGLPQKTQDHQLRIAPQVSRYHPVAVSVETDAHTQAAHHKRIVDVRQAEDVEQQVGEQRYRYSPADVV